MTNDKAIETLRNIKLKCSSNGIYKQALDLAIQSLKETKLATPDTEELDGQMTIFEWLENENNATNNRSNRK